MTYDDLNPDQQKALDDHIQRGDDRAAGIGPQQPESTRPTDWTPTDSDISLLAEVLFEHRVGLRDANLPGDFEPAARYILQTFSETWAMQAWLLRSTLADIAAQRAALSVSVKGKP